MRANKFDASKHLLIPKNIRLNIFAVLDNPKRKEIFTTIKVS